MTDRSALATRFLVTAGWGTAHLAPLAGDASDRSYVRLTMGTQSAILMDAPPGQGDDPADFVKIARYLAKAGLSAPKILAEDLSNGFLLIEDFGDAVYAQLLLEDPTRELPLYTSATDALIHLARAPLPPGLPDLTAQDWAEAACLILTEYAEPLTGAQENVPFRTALTNALTDHANGPRIFIHRDYHAENLIHLPTRQGLPQVGILDFQLGQAGQPGYDLVSLLQDARRDVGPQTETAMIAHYAASLGLDALQFSASYATLGAQRALRILGIFARLARKSGKPRYLPMIPRVWSQLQRNLAHPALQNLRAACASLPPPTPETLRRLTAT